MTAPMNYDYMPSVDSSMNGYGSGINEDFDDLLDFTQAEGKAENHPGRTNNIFDFGGGAIYTPNSMNINGGMMTGYFSDNTMFQSRSDAPSLFANYGLPYYDTTSSDYLLPGRPDVDSTIIMGDGTISGGAQLSAGLLNVSDTQIPGSVDYPQTSAEPIKHFQENEDGVAPEPKPKRTRRSKKKKLTPEQEEKKRKEFLERNRVAASKCRTRKQEATAGLQERVQAYGRDNVKMKFTVVALENEIAILRKQCCDHVECNDPELKAGMEHHKATYSDHSIYGDNSSPATPQSNNSFGSMPGQSVGSPATIADAYISAPAAAPGYMQRTGSGTSNRSNNLYHADGTLNLRSPDNTNAMLRAENKKAKAKDEEFMKVYREQNKTAQEEYEIAMSRQYSKSSTASSGALSSGHEGLECTTLNTTPENLTKEVPCPMTSHNGGGTRRGMQQKSLDNPRFESLINNSLPGVSPLEFLSLK